MVPVSVHSFCRWSKTTPTSKHSTPICPSLSGLLTTLRLTLLPLTVRERSPRFLVAHQTVPSSCLVLSQISMWLGNRTAPQSMWPWCVACLSDFGVKELVDVGNMSESEIDGVLKALVEKGNELKPKFDELKSLAQQVSNTTEHCLCVEYRFNFGCLVPPCSWWWCVVLPRSMLPRWPTSTPPSWWSSTRRCGLGWRNADFNSFIFEIRMFLLENNRESIWSTRLRNYALLDSCMSLVLHANLKTELQFHTGRQYYIAVNCCQQRAAIFPGSWWDA